MASSRSWVWVLAWLAGAVSAGANVYLLTRAPERPRGTSAGTVAAERPEAPACDLGCPAELAACREASGRVPPGAWGAGTRPAASPAPTPATAPAAAVAGPHDAVCQVARDKLHDQWLEKKDAIAGGLAMMLADPAKQREDAERDAKRAADTLGLSGRARRDFEDRFTDTQVERLRALAPLAQGSSTDWQGLLDGARGVFDAEDAVVARQLGNDGVSRYQAAERSNRLTILTMLATYANVDWDEAAAAP